MRDGHRDFMSGHRSSGMQQDTEPHIQGALRWYILLRVRMHMPRYGSGPLRRFSRAEHHPSIIGLV